MNELLEEMWVMVLRASDDIKDSVRAAAGGALRTLRSVTLRLADPAATSPADAAAAVALMLPFLLQTGVQKCQPVDENNIFMFCCKHTCPRSCWVLLSHI